MKYKFFTINIAVAVFFTMLCNNVQASKATNSLDFEEVIITPNPTNKLSATAIINLTDTANVFFRYKNMQNDTAQYVYTEISKENKEHLLAITTLKELTKYQIEAIAFNKNNYITLDTFTFETGAIEARLNNFENFWHSGFYETPQYTIINLPAGQESYFIASDLRGNVVWYHKYSLDYNSCNAWRLTDRNTILYANCKEIVELDFYGNIIRNITTEEPSWNFHHDVQYLSNGNLAVIYAQPEIHVIDGQEEIVIVDGFLIYNDEDEIVYNWKASDFYEANKAKFMGGYWSQIFGQRTFDWCHFNSIAEDFDNNILISSSHWSKIIKINRFTGNIIWELGEEGTLLKDTTFTIQRQHSIEPISPHKYLLFDNLGNKGASRAVEFAVDPNTNFAFPFWQYEPPEKVTSPTRGNIQRLPNGNTMVFFPTNKGLIHEVNANGQLLWEIEIIRSGYRAYRTTHLIKPHQQVTIELSDTICSNATPLAIITSPTNAYLSGDNIVDGELLTEGLEGTTQTITAVYGNSLVEKNVFIANKEVVNVELTDSVLILPAAYNNYQWYFEESLLENEINATLTPTEDGLYYASFENKYACTNYSDTINYVKTDIANFEQIPSYKIITNNKFVEIYSMNNTIKEIEIYTLDGKLLMADKTAQRMHKISLQNYTGLFVLKINNSNNIFTKKIVI